MDSPTKVHIEAQNRRIFLLENQVSDLSKLVTSLTVTIKELNRKVEDSSESCSKRKDALNKTIREVNRHEEDLEDIRRYILNTEKRYTN